MANLITVDRAKEFLPNASSSDDPIIENLVSAASQLIERDCRRTFAVNSYDEVYNGNGMAELILNQFPVSLVSRVAVGTTDVLHVQHTDTAASRATVRVTATGLSLVSVKNGVTTANTLTFASNVTINAVASAISAISNWTGTVQGSYGGWASADLKALQGAYTALRPVALRIHTDDIDYFEVNETGGIIYRPCLFPRGYRNVRVQYEAGFDVIPEPIQQAAAELTAAAYLARGLNPNLQSETLGQYAYTQAVSKGYETLSIVARKAINLYRNARVPAYKAI